VHLIIVTESVVDVFRAGAVAAAKAVPNINGPGPYTGKDDPRREYAILVRT
jgi:hypothetical protein